MGLSGMGMWGGYVGQGAVEGDPFFGSGSVRRVEWGQGYQPLEHRNSHLTTQRLAFCLSGKA